ncbi:MAG: sn-glycerol-3-phosphate ABC transporter ATP-binding protein UgpC [Pirellulaceae bacterium]
MAEVILSKLAKHYGKVVAVDGIDLAIHDRELLVLVGPSGSGKTTTLRMVAGLETITSGEIRIGSRVVNHVAPKDRDIAMVFQKYALYPHMNVFQNMSFGLRMRRTPKAEIQQRVAAAAQLLGIGDLMDRKPAQLSGGQQQRVAVGRAIVRQPAVFLFDEPLSNLDAKLRVTMRTELVKLQKRLETTMIYVTHDQVEAMMMGDRVVVMNHGRIQQVGEPMQVYDRPANRFVAEFIGSPPMNFFDGRLAGDTSRPQVVVGPMAISLPAGHVPADEFRVDRSVSVGLRPEHITIHTVAGNEATPSETLTAEVLVSQPLGAETIVDLNSEFGELVVRARECDGLAW